MSIWAAGIVAGETDDYEHDGSVVSYINGWSNHYPGEFVNPENPGVHRFGSARDITEETPAAIGTGWLPPWCVPGHSDTGDDIDTHVGPWLRLDLMMRTVSIWSGVEIGYQDVHSVCLNEDAVKALRDNLTEWIDREKVRPKESE